MNFLKRSAGLFLAMLLCMGIIPVSVLAAEGSGGLGNFTKKNVWTDSLFEDVAETDWFRDNVRSVYEYGLMVGKGKGIFDPAGSVTVAELLTVAARLHAVYRTGSDFFAPTVPWYAGYADYCVGQGIVEELPDDMNAPAPRGLVAAVLAAAIPEKEFDAKNAVPAGAIPDVSLEDSFGPAVYLLYRAGIVIGNDGEGTFAPYSDVKRSEAAAMLTRVIDRALRMDVTLTAEEPAEEPAGEQPAAKGNALADKPGYTKPYLNLAAWESMIRRGTPPQQQEPEDPEEPPEPEDPTDELTAAYNRLVEEQLNCHMTVMRKDVLTNRTTSTQFDYDYDGQYVRAAYSDSGDFTSEDYYFRNDSGEVEYGLRYGLGAWYMMDEWTLRYTVFDFPFFPPDIDSSLYEESGDGWYQASESARNGEATRLINHLSDEYTAGTYTVEDFRIRVEDGRVSAMSLAYTKEGRSGSTSHTENYLFSDFGSVAVDFPENFAVSMTGADLLEDWSQGEEIDGMKVLYSGYVAGLMDECFILTDMTAGVVPVYFAGIALSQLDIDVGDALMLIGTVDCGRFRGGVPAIVVDGLDQAEAYYGFPPDVQTSGDDLETLTESRFDLADFSCLLVPEIPDEAELEAMDYTVEVEDAYGNKACLYLGDSDTAEQRPAGNAAAFRAGLREYVRKLLDSSGGSVCELDFTFILVTDGTIFAPIHETKYQKSDGPDLAVSPAVRSILPDPKTTLRDALTGVYAKHTSGKGEKTPVLDLDFSCPGFDPEKPGDYEVRVVYKGIELSCTIRVLGPENGAVYLDEMTADTLKDLTDQGIFPGSSLPVDGDVNILVIPIRFTDSPAYDVDLETAFNSTDHSTGWYSLSEYYEEVSFGQLRLHADILPVFDAGMDTKTAERTYWFDLAGEFAKLAMEYYDEKIDYTLYDQNDDGRIDCVYLVYDAPLETSRSEWWSFSGNTFGKFDGKQLDQYIWISAETFLSDFWISSSTNAPEEDTDGVALNCRVLIHETGHALSLPDLYGYTCNPTGDTVMMCANIGDHDPLSKMILGWIHPAFDYASPQEHLELKSYTTVGDALIISPDEEQSYFKDYYIVSLYTPEGVNEAFGDKDIGLFSNPGVVIYRVKGELEKNPTSLVCFAHDNFNSLENALIRLIQNNGRDTLGDSWNALAENMDLYLEGDSYTFAWEEDLGAPSMTMTVNRIYQDADGAWRADITLK